MNPENSRITVNMVSSLDGFISKKDQSISWMHSKDNYENGIDLTEELISEFLKSVDCYLMGSKTYEHAVKLGWPYGEVPVFVFTNRNLKSDNKNVSFLSGNLNKIVSDKLKNQYENIWMVGGTMLTKQFLQLGLADEINITILPTILGDGKLFFDFIGKEIPLHLKNVTAYKDGMVELVYEILDNKKSG